MSSGIDLTRQYMNKDEYRRHLESLFRRLFYDRTVDGVTVDDVWEVRIDRRKRLVDSYVYLYRNGLLYERERLGRWKTFNGFLRVMTTVMFKDAGLTGF